MWGLQIQRQGEQFMPLINTESMILVVVFLLVLRVGIQKILGKHFMVRGIRPEHSQNTLEYSYFYHLSIIILILTDVNWNIFDLVMWFFSYVCIGMLRKAVHVARMEKEAMLNDYAYNSNLVSVLQASKLYGICLFLFSSGYFLWVTYCFSGIPVRMTSLLLFPTLMLGVDSIFLFLSSVATSSDLLCYYNQNINQIPTAYKLEIYHNVACSAIRVAHFFTITRIFLKTFFQKFEFLDCLWMLSVFNACYNAAVLLLKSISQYSFFKKLTAKMESIFRRAASNPDRICIICREDLLNCRRLASCGHLFHFKCLFQWVQTKSECPICRHPIALN